MSVQFKRGDKVVVDWGILFDSPTNYDVDRRGGFLYEDDNLVIDDDMKEELSSPPYLVVAAVDDSDNTVKFKRTKGMSDSWWLPAFCLSKVE